MTVERELASGRLANIDAVLWARESVINSGVAAGLRAVDIQVWGGIGVRIYPDRGLDLGQAWYRGVPLAWVSRVGEVAAVEDLQGMDWGKTFGGGLMTTCGLHNVGMPSEGHGLHGTYSHLPASAVEVRRFVTENEAGVVVTGVIDDPASPAPLRVERTIRTLAGVGRLEIDDVTTNLGDSAAAAPVLYHFNFGYPLWAGPARLEIPVASTVARDPDSEGAVGAWRRPLPVAKGPEHEMDSDAECGCARIVNSEVGVVLTLRWDRGALPRLNQWLDPNPGMSVLRHRAGELLDTRPSVRPGRGESAGSRRRRTEGDPSRGGGRGDMSRAHRGR